MNENIQFLQAFLKNPGKVGSITPSSPELAQKMCEGITPDKDNVVLELGMFLSTLGRKRVAILHKGEVELPSDIHGLVYIPFQKHVTEVKQRLAAELQEAGFHINIKDLLAN